MSCDVDDVLNEWKRPFCEKRGHVPIIVETGPPIRLRCGTCGAAAEPTGIMVDFIRYATSRLKELQDEIHEMESLDYP